MSAMATDGATLDCFLKKLMALPTVLSQGSRGAMLMDRPALPLNFPGVGREGQKEFAAHL